MRLPTYTVLFRKPCFRDQCNLRTACAKQKLNSKLSNQPKPAQISDSASHKKSTPWDFIRGTLAGSGSFFTFYFQGTIRGCKLALKYMGKDGYGSRMSTNRGGVILNISSVQGLMAWPAMPTYSAAKAGMIRPIPVVEFQVFLIKIGKKKGVLFSKNSRQTF